MASAAAAISQVVNELSEIAKSDRIRSHNCTPRDGFGIWVFGFPEFFSYPFPLSFFFFFLRSCAFSGTLAKLQLQLVWVEGLCRPVWMGGKKRVKGFRGLQGTGT